MEAAQRIVERPALPPEHPAAPTLADLSALATAIFREVGTPPEQVQERTLNAIQRRMEDHADIHTVHGVAQSSTTIAARDIASLLGIRGPEDFTERDVGWMLVAQVGVAAREARVRQLDSPPIALLSPAIAAAASAAPPGDPAAEAAAPASQPPDWTVYTDGSFDPQSSSTGGSAGAGVVILEAARGGDGDPTDVAAEITVAFSPAPDQWAGRVDAALLDTRTSDSHSNLSVALAAAVDREAAGLPRDNAPISLQPGRSQAPRAVFSSEHYGITSHIRSNNAAEAAAVAAALVEATRSRARIIIRSDSQYVVDALRGPNNVQTNLSAWGVIAACIYARIGLVRAGQLVPFDAPHAPDAAGERPNDAALAAVGVRVSWVRAHAGDPLNERADRLANYARATSWAPQYAPPGPPGAPPDRRHTLPVAHPGVGPPRRDLTLATPQPGLASPPRLHQPTAPPLGAAAIDKESGGAAAGAAAPARYDCQALSNSPPSSRRSSSRAQGVAGASCRALSMRRHGRRWPPR